MEISMICLECMDDAKHDGTMGAPRDDKNFDAETGLLTQDAGSA